MKLRSAIFVLAAASVGAAQGQISFTSTSATTAWNAARWNNSSDAAPYTSTFTANNAVNFTSGTYTFAGMGAPTDVGNVTVASGVSVTFASIGSTYATGGAVRTINVGSGGLFDLNANAFSTAAGTGLIKSGAGVFGTGAGTFTGGFTLNAGTVIARGTTGLGSGTTNTLALNGGTLASNDTRAFASTRFGGGITIGGNVQFGEMVSVVSLASSPANLSFANNVSLGNATRTLTQGNNGSNTFSAIISNTGTGGITFAANSGTDGRFEITNTANTFTGDISINGGEARFTTDGSMGNAANDLIMDGGRFAKAGDSTTVTLGSERTISIGDGVGTSISSPSTGTMIYNGAIANKSGETGSWAKQGDGTLVLGGASTYTGNTAINNGIVRLTTGNDRLPTGTVVSLGQAADFNLGTLNLNGLNQQIAGLNSTAGTSSSTNNNTATSDTAATFTINTAGLNTYSFGDGTAANSGVITGAISLVKSGTGTQTLGDTNTYTGTTTINGGILAVNGSLASGSAVTVNSGGTLGGTGTVSGTVTAKSGGIVGPGNSPGVLTTGATTFESGSIFSWELNNNLDGDTVDPGDTGVRGTNYDGLTSTSLAVASGAIFRVVLTGTAAITNTFWDQNQTWTNIFSVSGSTTNAATGQLFNTFEVFNGMTNVTPASSSEGAFSFNNSTLTWTAVPEPSSALAGLLLAAGLLRRRRVA